MRGNKEPYIEDPEDFNGDYVGAGEFEKIIVNEYDLRAFGKYMEETGRTWNELSAEEKNSFKLTKYK
jgi:hypothetical protein